VLAQCLPCRIIICSPWWLCGYAKISGRNIWMKPGDLHIFRTIQGSFMGCLKIRNGILHPNLMVFPTMEPLSDMKTWTPQKKILQVSLKNSPVSVGICWNHLNFKFWCFLMVYSWNIPIVWVCFSMANPNILQLGTWHAPLSSLRRQQVAKTSMQRWIDFQWSIAFKDW
jgi:hypothetical protein